MYRRRVEVQKNRNPCLSDLHEFLRRPGTVRSRSRIVSVDFFSEGQGRSWREVEQENLSSELTGQGEGDVEHKGRSQIIGQILIFEDISNASIEELGTTLDIDPYFFASYIHSAFRNINTQNPQGSTLPSREREQSFISLQYHRTTVVHGLESHISQLTRNCHHQRKLAVLSSIKGRRLGLAQHCCSVLTKDRPDGIWLCIILVDPPLKNDYLQGRSMEHLPKGFHLSPFLGGCEDFSTAVSTCDTQATYTTSQVDTRGMLDELLYHWTQSEPPMFDPAQPSLQSLTYYPLKLVAAEWVNYVAVMAFSIKEYERTSKPSTDMLAEIESLNVDLRMLQSWRRRVISTQKKMRQTLRFISMHRSHDHSDSLAVISWSALHDDYEFLSTEITEHAQCLESMVPVIMSSVQLIEGRRSLAETANITRLTVLAFFFVPLGFVASLFSMSDDHSPGGGRFWVYWVVAIPLTVGIVLVANPPIWFLQNIGKAIRRLMRRNNIREL